MFNQASGLKLKKIFVNCFQQVKVLPGKDDDWNRHVMFLADSEDFYIGSVVNLIDVQCGC